MRRPDKLCSCAFAGWILTYRPYLFWCFGWLCYGYGRGPIQQEIGTDFDYFHLL